MTLELTYLFFMAIIILLNVIFKYADSVLYNEPVINTKPRVLIISLIVFIIFWFFGANVLLLLLYMFASFGFYDFVGKYIEDVAVKFFQYLKSLLKLY